MITITVYFIVGFCVAALARILATKFKVLYWLTGDYTSLAMLFSILFWPVFVPCVIIFTIFDLLLED